MFASFLAPGKGIGVDMTDNGQYSGTLFFMGENEEILKKPMYAFCLRLCTILP